MLETLAANPNKKRPPARWASRRLISTIQSRLAEWKPLPAGMRIHPRKKRQGDQGSPTI